MVKNKDDNEKEAVPEKFQELVEKIEALNIVELSELVKILEKRFGDIDENWAEFKKAKESAGTKEWFFSNFFDFMIQNRAILLTAQDLHGLPRSESLLEKVAEYKNTVDTVTSGEIFAVLKEQSDFEAKKIIAAFGRLLNDKNKLAEILQKTSAQDLRKRF